MALSQTQLDRFKSLLDGCSRPVIIFDDDPDGLCSFLMVYKRVKEGKGIPVKNAPFISEQLARSVNDYGPDLVIILDMPIVSQEFLDAVSAKVVWLDHHAPLTRSKVEYFNPRVSDDQDNRPTSYWVYRALQEHLWIGMVGMIGDWFMPEEQIRQDFIRSYPDLLPEEIVRPEDALHNSRLGELVQVFSFNLKGKSSDVLKGVKASTRVEDPYDILDSRTAGGKFLYKKYSKLRTEYDAIRAQVSVGDGELLVFAYKNENFSFSAELANELIYRNPDKVVLVAWEYGGEYKCSLRSINRNLPQMIEKALVGLDGYGGGHDHAAGACVKTHQFQDFVNALGSQL